MIGRSWPSFAASASKKPFPLLVGTMVLSQRTIPPGLAYAHPEGGGDRFHVLMDMCHHQTTGALEQVSALFVYAHQVLGGLAVEAASTSQRVLQLGQRVEALAAGVRSADAKMAAGADMAETGTKFRNRSAEASQQFLSSGRVESIKHQYEQAMPPPQLSLLDPFVEGSCLKKYTNKDFFLETWVEEQQKKYEEAKLKRAEKKKSRARKPSSATSRRRVVKQVELSRAKYSAMGAEFRGTEQPQVSARQEHHSPPPEAHTEARPQVEPVHHHTAPTPAPPPVLARTPTPTPAPAPAPAAVPSASPPRSAPPPGPPPASFPPPTAAPVPPTSAAPPSVPTSAPPSSAPSLPPPGPPVGGPPSAPAPSAPAPATETFPPPPSDFPPPPAVAVVEEKGGKKGKGKKEKKVSKKEKAPKKDKKAAKKEKKEKKEKEKKEKKSKGKGKREDPPSTPAPAPPSAPAAPPASAAPPSRAPAPPPAPAPPAAPPPPMAPAPPSAPPPPAAGSPAPPRAAGGGGGALAAIAAGVSLSHVSAEDRKPANKTTSLLSSIQQGVQLRKVEVQEKEVKADSGAFDVAKILARRAAMEFSDSDSDGDDDDWD